MRTRHKIAIARIVGRFILAIRRLYGIGPVTEVTRLGLRWKLDLREGIDLSIYLMGTFEWATTRVCRRLLKAGDVALDIGANIGAHTIPLARCVGPEGRVFAFEPTDFAFQKLVENVQLNRELADRISLHQIMLGDMNRSGPLDPVYSSWPIEESRDLHPQHQGRLETCGGDCLTSLDVFLEQSGVTRVDFIKLDVDGNECLVLNGARRLLQELSPTILLEVAPYCHEEKGHNLNQCFEPLLTAGYELLDETHLNNLPRGACPSGGPRREEPFGGIRETANGTSLTFTWRP